MSTKTERNLRNSIIDILLLAKNNDENKQTYQEIVTIFNPTYPWLNENMLRQAQFRKRNKRNNTTTIPTLTPTSQSQSLVQPQSVPPSLSTPTSTQSLPPLILNPNSTQSLPPSLLNPNTTQSLPPSLALPQPLSIPPSSLGGRPKGSTILKRIMSLYFLTTILETIAYSLVVLPVDIKVRLFQDS